MNFEAAYSLMFQGHVITKPGLGWSMKLEKGRLMKEYPGGIWHNLPDLGPSLIHLFAQNDWYVKDMDSNKWSNKVVIKFKKIRNSGWIEPVAPFHAHEDDRGFDLTCVEVDRVEEYVWRYHSGLAFAFPEGIDGEVRARSSIYKTGLILSNGVGTIDHGYTGEVQAVFYEMLIDRTSRMYRPGDRFVQLVIPNVDPRNIVFEEVNELPVTSRGAGGYGSSGK